MWFVERVSAAEEHRRRGRRPPDAARSSHQALFTFFKGLPKRTGVDRVQPETLEDALVFLRECLADALVAHVRFDLPELERSELEQGLARDLEKLIRREAESESPLVPHRFEVSFGSERSRPRAAARARPRRLRASRARSTGSTATRSARAGSSSTTSPAARATAA